MRRVTDGYDGRVLIGEIYNALERVMAYYGRDGAGCHFPYNFQLIPLPWDARLIDATIRRYEALLPPGGWPNWVLGNHDRHRVASRVGAEQARVAAILLLTLRGTPTIYYGDEIGMSDVAIPPDRVQDPWELNLPGRGLGRDPERTPMQWDRSHSAGFTTGEPWLPTGDPERCSVDAQRDDPDSILTLHRRLLALRRAEPALAVGAWAPVDATGSVLAYLRTDGASRFLVALNLGSEPARLEGEWAGEVALSSILGNEGAEVSGAVSLVGGEGVVIRLRA
jgi:alpha-glucosidase